MFENLGDRLQNAIDKIKGYGKITEDNISDMTREIRLALLEADVNYKVVKEFINKKKKKALGEEVKKSLKPAEVFVKIVKDELVNLLGGEKSDLIVNNKKTITMLVGLQGSGKTTTVGKLGNLIRKKYKKKPMFVACDIYRPAAVDQLKQIGKSLNIETFSKDSNDPVDIIKDALIKADEEKCDYILIDTAGRLHIDDELMDELTNINNNFNIDEILLVVDGMIGQDIINVVTKFNETLPLTGVIITKLDGDVRGGAALSIRHLTNVPIKMIGISEKMDGIQEFDPERMASRILGMGDLMSIVEKVEDTFDEEEAKKSINKMKKGKFDLEDFLMQLKQIKKLGPLENIIKLLPGAKKLGLNNIKIDPKQMAHIEAIILSMTPKERSNPEIIKASRKKRIAQGSGRDVSEVNKLLEQFEQMKKMMKQISSGNFKMPGGFPK